MELQHDEIEIHYVTAKLAIHVAEDAKKQKDGHEPGFVKRHDLAKFFEHAHAVAHAETIGHGWVEKEVETRVEKMSAQHPAHRPG
jgi:hypothetical protein